MRAEHTRSEAKVSADLRRVLTIDRSPATRSRVRRLLKVQAAYRHASNEMFRAVDARRPARVIRIDHGVVDPVFDAIEDSVYRQATLASRRGLAGSADLRLR